MKWWFWLLLVGFARPVSAMPTWLNVCVGAIEEAFAVGTGWPWPFFDRDDPKWSRYDRLLVSTFGRFSVERKLAFPHALDFFAELDHYAPYEIRGESVVSSNIAVRAPGGSFVNGRFFFDYTFWTRRERLRFEFTLTSPLQLETFTNFYAACLAEMDERELREIPEFDTLNRRERVYSLRFTFRNEAQLRRWLLRIKGEPKAAPDEVAQAVRTTLALLRNPLDYPDAYLDFSSVVCQRLGDDSPIARHLTKLYHHNMNWFDPEGDY